MGGVGRRRSEKLRRVGKSELIVPQLGCGGGGWANFKVQNILRLRLHSPSCG
jgi:hypothetical protein